MMFLQMTCILCVKLCLLSVDLHRLPKAKNSYVREFKMISSHDLEKNTKIKTVFVITWLNLVGFA